MHYIMTPRQLNTLRNSLAFIMFVLIESVSLPNHLSLESTSFSAKFSANFCFTEYKITSII